MKNFLFIFSVLLADYAQAGGGRNTHTPDNFLKVMGFILVFALLIDSIKRYFK